MSRSQNESGGSKTAESGNHVVPPSVITHDDALAFLAAHQLIPSEDELGPDDFDAYCDVLTFLEDNPDPCCVPVLLNSIGPRSSAAICKAIAGVLRNQDAETVKRHLVDALVSRKKGLVEWAATYVLDRPAVEFVEPLRLILRDAGSSTDAVLSAVSALECIRDRLGLPEVDQVITSEYESNPLWDGLRQQVAKQQEGLARAGMQWVLSQSEIAFSTKDYARVVALLGPHGDDLPECAKRRLALARKFVSRRVGSRRIEDGGTGGAGDSTGTA